jgi:hypothetical protein
VEEKQQRKQPLSVTCCNHQLFDIRVDRGGISCCAAVDTMFKTCQHVRVATKSTGLWSARTGHMRSTAVGAHAAATLIAAACLQHPTCLHLI